MQREKDFPNQITSQKSPLEQAASRSSWITSHPHASSQHIHASRGAQPSASATHSHFQQLSRRTATRHLPTAPKPPSCCCCFLLHLPPALAPGGARQEPLKGLKPLCWARGVWGQDKPAIPGAPLCFLLGSFAKKWEVSAASGRTGVTELLALATAFCIPVFSCCVCFMKI